MPTSTALLLDDADVSLLVIPSACRQFRFVSAHQVSGCHIPDFTKVLQLPSSQAKPIDQWQITKITVDRNPKNVGHNTIGANTDSREVNQRLIGQSDIDDLVIGLKPTVVKRNAISGHTLNVDRTRANVLTERLKRIVKTILLSDGQ